MAGLNTNGISNVNTTINATQASANAAQQGNIAGNNAQIITNPVSIFNTAAAINNAAEEMTFKASEFASAKLSKKSTIDELHEKSKLEEIARKYLENVQPVEQKQQLEVFIKNLSSSDVTADELRNYLNDYSSDSTEQFAALVQMKKAFQHSGKMTEIINELIVELYEEQGATLAKNFSISVSVLEASADGLASVDELRNSYSDYIKDYPSLVSALDGVVEQYGESKVFDGIRFLLNSTGSHLNSTTHLKDTVKLKLVHDQLSSLNKINTLGDQIDDMCNKLQINLKDISESA